MKLPVAGDITTLVKKFGKEMIEQKYILPNGTADDFVMFRARTGLTAPAAAIVFPLTPDNQVVAISQFRYGADGLVLEIPGGNPKGLEAPEEIITSELAEETGYRPEKVIVLNPRAKYWFEPASMRAWYVPVLALGCVKVHEPQPDPTEYLEVVTIPLVEWMKKIESGEITDDKTIAITTLSLMYLGLLGLKL